MKPFRNFFLPLAATMSPFSAIRALMTTKRQMNNVILLDEIMVSSGLLFCCFYLDCFENLTTAILLRSNLSILFDSSLWDALW
jgi:hypothetical protein